MPHDGGACGQGAQFGHVDLRYRTEGDAVGQFVPGFPTVDERSASETEYVAALVERKSVEGFDGCRDRRRIVEVVQVEPEFLDPREDRLADPELLPFAKRVAEWPEVLAQFRIECGDR